MAAVSALMLALLLVWRCLRPAPLQHRRHGLITVPDCVVTIVTTRGEGAGSDHDRVHVRVGEDRLRRRGSADAGGCVLEAPWIRVGDGDEPVSGKPPYKRDVNTVFQSYALFPHMTVAENVAYGLRQKGVPKAQIGTRVAEALDVPVVVSSSSPPPMVLPAWAITATFFTMLVLPLVWHHA